MVQKSLGTYFDDVDENDFSHGYPWGEYYEDSLSGKPIKVAEI
jgi:hypothetical protein